MENPADRNATYPKLRAFKKQHLGREAFRRYGVNGIGIGRKIVSGERTDTPCLRFYVSCKRPASDLPQGQRIPAFFQYTSEDGQEVELPTDVIERQPYCFNMDPEGRFRPVPGGVSGGSFFTGTVGGWAWDRTDASFVMLTACHVVGFFDVLVQFNAPFLQPGLSDGGETSSDRVGTVKRLVELVAGGTTTVDAAIAEPSSSDIVQTNVLGIGPSIYAVADPTEGMAVQKSGKTTGLTEGEIVDTDLDTFVFLGDDIYFFEDVIEIEASGDVWAEGGDSGAVVFSQAAVSASSSIHPAVGLHFASVGTMGLASKMRNVFEQLNLEPICDGLFADFVEEMAAPSGAISSESAGKAARGILPHVPVERRFARAASPARGLAQDLRTRLAGSSSGRMLTDFISKQRAGLVELFVGNGDVRRAATAAFAPILEGAVTTTDVLSRRIDPDDVKRLKTLFREFQRSGDKQLRASLGVLEPLLDKLEGKSLGDVMPDETPAQKVT